MNLPRLLLLRLRRRMRRRYPAKPMIPAGPHSLHRIGWAGGPPDDEPPEPKRMKLIRCLFVFLLLAAVICGLCSVSSCTTTTTRTIAPDGTIVETTVQSVDPASVQAVATTATAFAPARVIHEEKSAPNMRAILNNRRPQRMALEGPVSTEEVEKRWKPAAALAK